MGNLFKKMTLPEMAAELRQNNHFVKDMNNNVDASQEVRVNLTITDAERQATVIEKTHIQKLIDSIKFDGMEKTFLNI